MARVVAFRRRDVNSTSATRASSHGHGCVSGVHARLRHRGVVAPPELSRRLARLDAQQLQIVEIMIGISWKEGWPTLPLIEPTVAAFERGVCSTRLGKESK